MEIMGSLMPCVAPSTVHHAKISGPIAAPRVVRSTSLPIFTHSIKTVACTHQSIRRSLLLCRADGASNAIEAATPFTTTQKGAPTSTEWELDFCSRPLVDERGKKIWELLICDPERNFEYAQYFPNNKINSSELKRALEQVLTQPGAVRPEKVRFFRGQMQTIITRALTELDVTPTPSRRCFALTAWLEDRIENVYKVHPGYSEKASTLFTLDLGAPNELPDALRGESWSFVQLPLGALRGELAAVEAGRAFGSTLDTASLGLDVNDETLVPGVAVYSRRANPMAAWTNGLELAAVVADIDRAFLILETGVNDRWRYAAYRRTLETTAEAQAWEETKLATNGLHFLAVMESEEADDCAGLWLLLDRKAPNV